MHHVGLGKYSEIQSRTSTIFFGLTINIHFTIIEHKRLPLQEQLKYYNEIFLCIHWL